MLSVRLWAGTDGGTLYREVVYYVKVITCGIDGQRQSGHTYQVRLLSWISDLDFYIGLPKEENYRCARVQPLQVVSLETLLATDYWNLALAVLFNPRSLIARVTQNPKEYSEVTVTMVTWRNISLLPKLSVNIGYQ